jgi:hypothetical protein
MRFLFIIFYSSILINSAYGQTPVSKHKKQIDVPWDLTCVHRNIYSLDLRLKKYPFNIADTVKLVSFRYHNNNYPIQKGHITSDSLIEEKILNSEEIGNLTDILYNYVPRKESNFGSETQCFFPRNAVLFIDKHGMVKEFVLICFHCSRFESSSDNWWDWTNCDQKSEKIHQFFISAGIKFGTDKSIMEYPGESDDN